jgi:hypothetical protein
MMECCNHCVINKFKCPDKKCKHWINYKEDLNCALIAIEKNGGMTLREVADRLGISFVRVKQIQDSALKKIQLKEIEINDI